MAEGGGIADGAVGDKPPTELAGGEVQGEDMVLGGGTLKNGGLIGDGMEGPVVGESGFDGIEALPVTASGWGWPGWPRGLLGLVLPERG